MLVFICIVVLIVLLISIVLLLSVINIVVNKLEISNEEKGKLIKDYEIHLQLRIIDKFKIIDIKINDELIEKFHIKSKLDKIYFEEVKKEKLSKEEIKLLFKKMHFEIDKLDLRVDLGIDDVILTSAVVGIISVAIGLGLAKIIKKYDSRKYKYIINPLYINKNILKINLNCIIKVKMVHIIYVIYILLKRRRVYKNERASNRRAYDYSYE